MTVQELQDAWLEARCHWLEVARAIEFTNHYYTQLSPEEFIKATKWSITYKIIKIKNPARRAAMIALDRAGIAAQLYIIGRDQGLDSAMLWKLSR